MKEREKENKIEKKHMELFIVQYNAIYPTVHKTDEIFTFFFSFTSLRSGVVHPVFR